jgi:hypothetical protein
MNEFLLLAVVIIYLAIRLGEAPYYEGDFRAVGDLLSHHV